MGVSQNRVDFYEVPSLYDILHASGTAREVDGLERIVERFVGRGKGKRRRTAHRTVRPGTAHRAVPPGRESVWLEPACGTGRYLRVAAGRGVRAIGFDESEAMIGYARRRMEVLGLERHVDLFCGDMTDFATHLGTGRIDFAFNLINTIRHLESDAAMLAHFEQMRRVLGPSGVYAVGLSLTAYGLEFPSEDVWMGARGRCRVRQVVQYEPAAGGRGKSARAERVYSHLTVTRPRGCEELDSAYELRSYSRGQWMGLLGRAGFEVLGVVDEDGRDMAIGAFGYGVYVLRPGN